MVKANLGGASYPWQLQRTALVAAEDSQVRRYVAEALCRSGYLADVHSDPQAMLEDLSTAGYAFLVLQGGRTGLEMLRQVRQRNSDLPIIVLSGGPAGEGCSLSVGRGSVERLSTPFTLEMLQLAIARVLLGYELESEGAVESG